MLMTCDPHNQIFSNVPILPIATLLIALLTISLIDNDRPWKKKKVNKSLSDSLFNLKINYKFIHFIKVLTLCCNNKSFSTKKKNSIPGLKFLTSIFQLPNQHYLCLEDYSKVFLPFRYKIFPDDEIQISTKTYFLLNTLKNMFF